MINLVVALPCEARPLIRYYALEALEGAVEFRIYAGEKMHLIVSGVGKTAALSAPAYLRALQSKSAGAAWLNLGIAGHGRSAVGVPLLAHKVVDAGKGQAYYPVFVFPPPCATTTVCTVDGAETHYAEPWAYDMEASAFCSAARRFASAELVHCFKIVSDAPAVPLGGLSKKKVEALVEGQLGLIDQVVATLSSLSAQLHLLHASPPLFSHCLEKWRFTVSQQHQLHRLLQGWHTLNPGAGLWTAEFQALQSGAQVLCFLEASITSHTPPF